MMITYLIKKYKITQTELSKKYQIPLRTVQAWYHGERNPPQYIIKMLDKLLEHKIDL